MKSVALEEIGTLKGMAPLHVLILEHSRTDVELILREAGLRFDYTLAENREQYRGALQQEAFDVILSAYQLPSCTGLEALQELRDAGRDTPFILVTGTLGEEAAVECIKQGVTDYIRKDHMSRLPLALRRAIGDKALREDAKRAHRALAESETRSGLQFAELDLLYRSLPVALAVFGRDMRFLRVSGYSQDSENIAPATANAHYLQKPYSPTTLGRVVREILDQTKILKASN
jgi:CheY-like chemotaxis protein